MYTHIYTEMYRLKYELYQGSIKRLCIPMVFLHEQYETRKVHENTISKDGQILFCIGMGSPSQV